MANFLQKTRNPFGDVHEYTPDYGFLTQVYGTRQAEYDRGFNMVKSLYNSQLNSALTNADNEMYRQDVFKKIQGSLRSAGGVDLSQPTNIMRATTLMDPLAKDTDLAYDKAVTEFHQRQKQKMEQYKNSADPDMRAMYNKDAELDIQYAEADLRHAKRGDGSITKVQPREFVPFEDVEKYLRTAAKDQNLKIEFDRVTGNGYIVSETNGAITDSKGKVGNQAYAAYARWAAVTMGPRFDRQFAVSGRVQSETAIRGVMQATGLPREQAIMAVAKKIMPEVVEQHAVQGINADAAVKEYDEQLAIFKKNYPNGVPVSLQQDYMKLVKDRKDHINQLEEARTNTSELQQGGAEYVAQNLQHIFTTKAKKQTATNWAMSYADATASRTIKSDEVYLTKYKVQSQMAMDAANRQSREKLAYAKMAQDEKHFGMNYELKVEDLKMKYKDSIPTETYVGQNTSGAKMAASDIVDEGYATNRQKIFNTAFGAGDGLMNLVVGAESHGKYYNVLNKVQNISNGSKQALSPAELATLAEYGKKVGVKITSIGNAAIASAALDTLAGATYEKAQVNAGTHAKQGKTKNVAQILPVFDRALAHFKTVVDDRSKINTAYKRMAGLVLDEYGNVKEQYKGATIKGYLPDGTPIMDTSKLDFSLRNHISTVVGKEFNSKTRPSGSIYELNKITPGEIFSFSNSNIGGSTAVGADGKKVDMSIISQLPPADVKKLFADSANAAYDPATKQVKVVLRVSPTEPLAKKLKLDHAQAITLTIPYASIQSNPALARLAKNVGKNSVNPESLGMMADFATDPYAMVESPGHTKQVGYSYSVAGVNDGNGRYGVGVTFNYTDPKTKATYSPYRFYPIDKSNSAESYAKVAEYINAMAQQHVSNRIKYESSIDDEDIVPYKD